MLANVKETERQWEDAVAEPMVEDVLASALSAAMVTLDLSCIYKGNTNVAETPPSWHGPLYTVHSLSVLSKLTCNPSLRRHNAYLIQILQ